MENDPFIQTLKQLGSFQISIEKDGERRVIQGDEGKKIGDMKINPFNGQPYSKKYYQILEQRQKLPVWEKVQMLRWYSFLRFNLGSWLSSLDNKVFPLYQ